MTQSRAEKKPDAGEAMGVLAAVCALTCLAGCVDALAVLHSAEFLPVYMTGDTTKLADALTDGAWVRALPAAAVIFTFLCSSVLAARLGRVGAESRPAPVLLPVAAAMGAVNQVLAKDPGVTFITGALVRASRALSAGEFMQAGKDLLRWTAFLTGAAAGALLSGVASRYVLSLPAAAALLAGLVLALRPSLSSSKES